MHFKSFILVFFLLVLFAAGCNVATRGDYSITKADVYYRSGQLDEALKHLKKLVSFEYDNIEAHLRIAEIYDEMENWEYARLWAERTMKLDYNNPGARLIYAKSCRERGYIRPQPLRFFDWKDAKKKFLQVMEVDSSFNKVLYEYAVFQGYKKEFMDGIKTLEAHRKYYPEDIKAFEKQNYYYDAICFLGEDEDIRELKQMDTDLARFYYGEYCRQHDMLEQADSVFQSLDGSRSISPTLYDFALAKLAVQQERYTDAERLYMAAIDTMATRMDVNFVYNDMKYVFSDAEFEYYDKIADKTDVRTFFKKSWLRRNPLPASPSNPRLIEHLKRMVYAEKNYRIVRVGKYRWSPQQWEINQVPHVYTLANRFEDRGVVYIRHGEPADKAIAFGGDLFDEWMQTSGKERWNESLRNGESWLYPASGTTPKMIFHFAMGNEAEPRLVPILPRIMVQDCYNWDKKYASYLNSHDYVEVMQFEGDIVRENRKNIEIGLETDRHQWDREAHPIDMPFYIAAFAAPLGQTRYELYYSIPPQTINNDSVSYYDLDLGLGIYDLQWDEIETTHKAIPVEDIIQQDDSLYAWTDQFTFTLDTIDHAISFYAKTKDLMHVGGHKFKLVPRTFNDTELCMSDLELARQLESSENSDGKFIKNQLRVVPQPSLKFNPKNPVYVYFEIYNLPVTQSRLEYQIQYKVNQKKAAKKGFLSNLPGFKGNLLKEQSATLERYSASRFSPESIGLDMSAMEPGEYEIEVRIVLADGEQVSQKQKFELLKN